MPCTELCGTTEIDIIFEFEQDFSDIVFQTESSTSNINISLEDTPSFNIEVLTQGLEGAKGDKGLKGDTGESLTFDLLSEEQKQALRGDVGNTSTNYVNIFYQSML